MKFLISLIIFVAVFVPLRRLFRKILKGGKTMLIKQGERYGAMVGNIRVFTMERAVEVYKMFAARCYADLTMEASVVLSNVGDDMHRLGFTWAEIEDMELEAIA